MKVKLDIKKPQGYPLDRHHVFNGPFRKASEKWGCVVYIPHVYHLYHGPHTHREYADNLKAEYQRKLEAAGWTREEFMEEFGRNYL